MGRKPDIVKTYLHKTNPKVNFLHDKTTKKDQQKLEKFLTDYLKHYNKKLFESIEIIGVNDVDKEKIRKMLNIKQK